MATIVITHSQPKSDDVVTVFIHPTSRLPITSNIYTHTQTLRTKSKSENQNKVQSNRLNFLLKSSFSTGTPPLDSSRKHFERVSVMDPDLSLLEISGEDDSLLLIPNDDASMLSSSSSSNNNNNNNNNYFLCSPLQIHGSKRSVHPPSLGPPIG